MQTSNNASVLARWTLIPIIALVALFISFAASFRLNGALYWVPFPIAAALLLLLLVRLAPSHKRIVAVATFVVVAAFFGKFIPHPNVGLPFGYWVYPNRAIKAFLECPNVQSAKVEWAYRDLVIEEFAIDVTISDTNGRTSTRSISFDQYPSRKYIVDRVATIGCQL